MISREIQRKIRHIEIYTKRLLSGLLIGDSRSAMKGSGFEFDQLRDYRMGDDIRCIDWKSSARYNDILIKQYVEERNRTIILAVDVSASSFFSSSCESRWDLFQQVAAVLTIVAEYGRDNVSLLLFSDEVELFIPPGRGRAHTHLLLNRLFSFEPHNNKTSLAAVLKKLSAMKRQDSVIFLLSDFIDHGYEKFLSVVAKNHDLIALCSVDRYELMLPDVGLLPIEDIETGRAVLLDTRAKSGKKLETYLNDRHSHQKKLFKKYRVDYLEVCDHKSMIADIVRFFRQRMAY